MKKTELQCKIENKKNNENTGGGWAIGCIPYSTYREINQIWHRIPTQEEYELYKLWCYIRGFDPEHINSIKKV